MKRWIAGGLLVSAAGLGYAYWPADGSWLQSGDRYKTQVLARGNVSKTAAANGILNPVRLVQVGTQVSGIVKRLYVDYNDRVEQGQILLELDDALYSAQVRQSRAALVNAQSAFDLAIANERRLQGLARDEFVTQQELDKAVQVRKAAAAQVEKTRATLEKDQDDLSDTVIRAPVSGMVIDRLVEEGQTVAANFQTPTLIRIAEDLAKMQIDANFAESDIGGIRAGQSVQFSVDAFPERTFAGRVAQVRLNPTIDQNVVTYDVVILVENSEHILFPGMTAYVNITLQESLGALLVPNASLRFHPQLSAAKSAKPDRQPPGKSGGDGGRVYVIAGAGQLRPVDLSLGIADGRMTEVLAGELKAGDAVVIAKTGEPDAIAGASQRRSQSVNSAK